MQSEAWVRWGLVDREAIGNRAWRDWTMRVGLIARGGRGPTGTSRYAQNLLAGLPASGASVEVVFPASPLPAAIEARLRGVGVDAHAFFDSYPLRVRPADVDIHHLTSQTMATLLALRRFPTPTVATVLDILPYLLRRHPRLRTLRHPIDELFYRLALVGLRRADALLAISDDTRRTLVRAAGVADSRIRVVPLAVDHVLFRPLDVPPAFRATHGLAAGDQLLLYVGSDDPRKDLDTLVRAFASLAVRQPRARLFVVGPAQFPGERTRLHAQAARLGVESRLRFVSGASDQELALFYNAADVFVFPSRYEGFGLPPLEAMACGTPVVAVRAGSVPEVVEGAGVLVAPGDADGLAGAVEGLLEDPARRRELAEAGRARAAGYTWARTVEETVAVYRELVRG